MGALENSRGLDGVDGSGALKDLLSSSGGKDLGLDSAGAATAAKASDAVAPHLSAEGSGGEGGAGDVEGKKTQSCLACIFDPCSTFFREIIWPVLEKIGQIARDYLFCWIFPTPSHGPKVVDITAKDLFSKEYAQQEAQVQYAIREKNRRIDRELAAGASFAGAIARLVTTGTMTHKDGTAIQAAVRFDREYLTGDYAPNTPALLEEKLRDLNVETTHWEFFANREMPIQQILFFAARWAGVDEGYEDEWIGVVRESDKTFGENIADIRKGFESYFSEMAQKVRKKRGELEDA